MKMRFTTLSIMILAMCSCNTSIRDIEREQSKGTFVYVLPKPVSALLQQKINPKDTTYFILEQDSSRFIIFIAKAYQQALNYDWVKKTDRKLLLNHTYYPLLLGSDEAFAIKETGDEILDRANREKYYSYSHILMTAELYCVKFEQDGAIVSTGY
jgi:hypothetical protein